MGYFICKKDGIYRGAAKGGRVDTKRLTGIVVVFLDLGMNNRITLLLFIGLAYWGCDKKGIINGGHYKNDNFFIIGKKKIIMMKYLLKKDKK